MKDTIVIIDSGIDKKYENILGGVTISFADDALFLTNETYKDEVGHGTAIYHIINDACENINFFIVKIFNTYETNPNLLFHALQYVHDNVPCEFIIISSGAAACQNKKAVAEIINKLHLEKNIFIVSAFNNDGALSFPSSHPNVIGVDSSEFVSATENYYIVKNSPVNILSSKRTQRLKWLNGTKQIISANSFLAPEYAAMLIESYQKSERTINNNDDLLDCICYKENKINVDENGEYVKIKNRLSLDYLPKVSDKKPRAIVFPFAKEIQTMAANEDLLQVDIVDYYDIRQSGKIGLEVGNLLGYCKNKKNIKDIQAIDWTSDRFDMIILGHCSHISAATNHDWFSYIYDLAREHDKYVLSFDPTDQAELDYPKLLSPPVITSFASTTFGKLQQISSPVLGVYGTSSKQGKFSLQLNLRRRFQKDGFVVGQLATEPTGYLFGMDYTLPTGFNRSIHLAQESMALFLNDIMHECSLNEPSIILTGCQSSTLAPTWVHYSQLAFSQYEFLIGTLPDGILLVVNKYDRIRYIQRTIAFIEATTDSSVIACVISPVKNSHAKAFDSTSELSAQINKPVFEFKDIEGIYKASIGFFGGG